VSDDQYKKSIAAWKRQMSKGWIGVDLDGTLAEYTTWLGPYHIGKPIEPMLARIKAWREAGIEVKIFTARASSNDPTAITAIKNWCKVHVGEELEVTCTKDYQMIELWDDRAVQVIPNTGHRADGEADACCYTGTCPTCDPTQEK
jgi:hypothetical protein